MDPSTTQAIAIPPDLLRRARLRACLGVILISLGLPVAAWGVVLSEFDNLYLAIALVVAVFFFALRLAFGWVAEEFEDTCSQIRARLATQEGLADECARVLGNSTPRADHTTPRPRL